MFCGIVCMCRVGGVIGRTDDSVLHQGILSGSADCTAILSADTETLEDLVKAGGGIGCVCSVYGRFVDADAGNPCTESQCHAQAGNDPDPDRGGDQYGAI